MASELIAGLGLFKTMMDIAKGLKDTNDAAIRNAAVIELQEKIFSAHTAQATLIERVRELESEAASFEAWSRQEVRYQLTQLPPGVFVYAIKEEARGGEPPHYACANCFRQRQVSYLNSDEPVSGRTKLHCPACGWEDRIGKFSAPQVRRSPRRGGPDGWMGN